jgi:hypothetical protein
MSASVRNFPAGSDGWGVCVTAGKGVVEVSISGPQTGHYPGDWMTPEQAEVIGLGIIQAAQTAREKEKMPVAAV